MTLERRHLNIAILILVAAVGYNFYSCVSRQRTRAPQAAEAPLLANVPAPRGAAPQPAFDATTVPVPPAVDLTTPPIWSRDPLLAPGESRKPTVASGAPANVAGPEPSLRSILYSPRRSLAIVDDRIVRVGDVVSSGTVVEIDPDGIVVQTASGERRRVAIHRGPTLAQRVP